MIFIKKTTQATVFIKNRGQWKLQKIKTSLNDIADIENLMKRKRVEDFKIWFVEDINTVRYWDDINFYSPVNFIYLPLKDTNNGKWAWFNLDENIPYPKYSGYSAHVLNMVVERMDEMYIQFYFPDFSEEKCPILTTLYDVNQLELMKEFLLNLNQNKQANCTVSGISPFTFLAWDKGDKIRFQIWSYEPEPLFKCKNGMTLLLDLEVITEEFYKQFDNFLRKIQEL